MCHAEVRKVVVYELDCDRGSAWPSGSFVGVREAELKMRGLLARWVSLHEQTVWLKKIATMLRQ